MKWDAFGPYAYSNRLVHYTKYPIDGDALLCGMPNQYGPSLTVHKSELVTCIRCIVLFGHGRRDVRTSQGYAPWES